MSVIPALSCGACNSAVRQPPGGKEPRIERLGVRQISRNGTLVVTDRLAGKSTIRFATRAV